MGDIIQTLADLVDERERLTGHRAAAASTSAERVVADLIAYASANPDSDLEDELSARLGDRQPDGPSPTLAERLRHSGAAADHRAKRGQIAALEQRQHAPPDGRHARGDRDLLGLQ